MTQGRLLGLEEGVNETEEYEVGEFVELTSYPGALWEIDGVDAPPRSGQISWPGPGGLIWSSNVSYGLQFPYRERLHLVLRLPGPGMRWSDCPPRTAIWKSATHAYTFVPEMEVIARFFAYVPIPFVIAYLLWERRIDPPNRYDVRRWICRRPQHRGAA